MATFQDTLRSPSTPDEQSFIAKRILETLIHQTECSLEDLIHICGNDIPDQVSLEVDRMSQSGEICLLYKKDGGFAVSLPRT
jgi:hypothetical protein